MNASDLRQSQRAAKATESGPTCTKNHNLHAHLAGAGTLLAVSARGDHGRLQEHALE